MLNQNRKNKLYLFQTGTKAPLTYNKLLYYTFNKNLSSQITPF